MIRNWKFALLTMILALMLFTASQAGAVIINELHTNPDVETELVEFIELHNPGRTDVDLSGWRLSEGIFYTFPDGTILPAGGYAVVAQNLDRLRAKWTLLRIDLPGLLVLGSYGGKLSNEGEKVVLCDVDADVVDEVEYRLGFPWPIVGDPVSADQPGTGHSLQLVNPQFDNDLGGSWRHASPTPGFPNMNVQADNIAPHIRQVAHSPREPRSGEPMTITAKVTDPDGVEMLVLTYQVVAPGHYIGLNDPQYEDNWVMADMHDDGFNGDAEAQDDVYTVQLPASIQVHRNLVRYRVFALDGVGNNITAPYAEDPQPNFAYFVYDGVPAWRGAVQPGVTSEVQFPARVMSSLPVYHLISTKSDVEDCTWHSKYGGSDYRWWGTLVYDGRVYDHIRYRARGGVWRYAMGKNMWKFDFNRGHSFQARDDYGNKYDTTWDKLNFSACIQQGSFGQRGEQGMFEALSFRLFNMADVPACKTNYLHFRIIDELYEEGTVNAAHAPLTSGGTQYDGDFWGLYMTIEQMDGRFLNEHDLPDGNLFKMDSSNREINNQGPTQPSDKSDLNAFLSQSPGASEPWWSANANLDAYYGYYAIYQAIHHGDITGKNWFLYHHPETDRWWQLPWDVDLTWTTYYGSSNPSDPWSRDGLLNHAELSMQNKNRLREIIDLLWNSEQTGQLIDEYAAIIDDPAGGLSMVDADRAMWDYHWVMGSGAYPTYLNREANRKAGQGRFYAKAAGSGYGRTFEGMVQVMKDYVDERASHMNSRAADSAIPVRPTVTSMAPEGYPGNGLIFQTSPFSDPQGDHTFAALKWRIAEVESHAVVTLPPNEGTVLIPQESTWKYFKGTEEPSLPLGQWRELDYDDSSWLAGATPIGYGESFIATNLSDMRGSYSTFYVRREFDIADPEAMGTLRVEAMFDDGINVWINGILVGSNNVVSDELPHTATTANRSENHSFTSIAAVDPSQYLVKGANVITAQLVNQSIGSSSDCFFDIRLTVEDDDPIDEQPSGSPANYTKRLGKYEIDAVWESGEQTEFSDSITIPASVVRPGRTYRVRCRMKDTTGRWSHWSVPIQFTAGEPIAAGIMADLRITELMYNPNDSGTVDNDEYEFIELMNVGDEALDLSTVSLTEGVTFEFADSPVTILDPGQFVLIVKNEAAFLTRYGADIADLIAGEYAGKLANSGERVKLEDFWNGTIAEFEYGDGRGWPLSADGAGHSLVPQASAILAQPAGSLNYGGNWRASAYMGGSPGADDSEVEPTVVLNELLAGIGSDDWIELYNPTDSSVDLTDWYLSDDIEDLKKWMVAAPALADHDFVSFETSGDDMGFGLNASGEQLFLSHLPETAEDRVVDSVSFKAQEEGVSLGRYPDGGRWWSRLEPSRGAANVNPLSDVVIDEIMYHPADANDEYVELFNPTETPIELAGPVGSWRLNGGIQYTFDAGLSLAPGDRVVVVGFDPMVDIARFGAFLVGYGGEVLIPGVQIVGPWEGSLANSGERVALENPQASGDSDDSVAWVLVDEVLFGDVAPWPTTPDGQGDALQRISVSDAGSDPANWETSLPNPGRGQ